VHPKPAKAEIVKLPNEPICHSMPKPVSQQLTTISSQIRTKNEPILHLQIAPFQPIPTPAVGDTALAKPETPKPRTERRLSVGFACGVARGFIYARSQSKIRNVGSPITIDQITRSQTKSKSQI
jgi:hypothetical protein